MKLLITGSKGFIGESLLMHLTEKGIPYIEFEGDIRNVATYQEQNVDMIIHLAALILQREPWTLQELHAVNIDGTRNLYEYYPDAKFIYISTIDVTAEPLTEYAKSKFEGERIVMQKEDNLVIRLPNIFGPNQRQDKLIPRLFRHYYQGQRCQLYNNDEREYLFVEDAAQKIWERHVENGIITLEGLKIRNKRLQQLIENVYLGKIDSVMTGDELLLFSQLMVSSKIYQAG